MRRCSRWRRVARQCIDEGIAEAARIGLPGGAVERFVRQTCYPFGERVMWPYKVWCSELRRVFKNERAYERKVHRRRLDRSVGQTWLF